MLTAKLLFSYCLLARKPNLKRLRYLHGNCDSSYHFYEKLIFNNTVESTNHLTPELKLRLITPECELWDCKLTEVKFPNDPFWGIYWPGGQSLARYILDNKNLFESKNILDIGSGSGACALAAAKCGASFVLANDIDPVSIIAIKINSKLNGVTVNTIETNLIGKDIDSISINTSNETIQPRWDVVLVGDMFYDTEFFDQLYTWLCELVEKKKRVYIGDPGRHGLKTLQQMNKDRTLVKVAEYELKNKEHNGFPVSSVYTIVPR